MWQKHTASHKCLCVFYLVGLLYSVWLYSNFICNFCSQKINLLISFSSLMVRFWPQSVMRAILKTIDMQYCFFSILQLWQLKYKIGDNWGLLGGILERPMGPWIKNSYSPWTQIHPTFAFSVGAKCGFGNFGSSHVRSLWPSRKDFLYHM